MLVNALRRILSVSPKGRTSRQIIRILEQASIKASRSEILGELDAMRRQRLITIDGRGRWHLKSLQAETQSFSGTPPLHAQVDAGGGLPAIRLTVRSVPECADADSFDENSEAIARPPIDRLLSYYEAAQRSDGRGPISQFAGGHEHQFQLFQAAGQWWSPSSTLAIDMGDLPPTFRYALSKRKSDAVVIGYPLATMNRDGSGAVIPVGLISASLSRTGYCLRITPQSGQVMINPEWVRRAGRGAHGPAKVLAEQSEVAGGLSFEDFCERIGACLELGHFDRLAPDDLVHSIDPATTGISNAGAIFLPSEASLTNHTAADLKRLAKMRSRHLAGTALWSLLRDGEPDEAAGPVLNPVPLTPDQLKAAELAMAGPLTAIAAPPGTGKGEIVVSAIASALAGGKSVLFASPNHQAIDALEDRFAELLPDQPLMVRTNSFDGDRHADFSGTAPNPAASEQRSVTEPLADRLQRLSVRAAKRSRILRNSAEAQRLNCILSEHIERRAEILGRVGRGARRTVGMISRLLRLFRHTASVSEALAPGATLEDLDAAIRRDKRALARLKVAEDPIPLSEDLVAATRDLFPMVVSRALAGDAGNQEESGPESERTRRVSAQRRMERAAAEALACRPIWAAQVRSVPSRVPLVTGMFDYVIIDDAHRCDIASALPLFARAKRAVVIGDPLQPEPAPVLGLRQELDLMGDIGLPPRGMAKYAQGRNSLFGFCAGRPATRSVMLRDQFRTAPAIVDYLNHAFYAGRLHAARGTAGLNTPDAARAGISWTDVRGRISLDQAGQPRNRDEASAIVAYLETLLGEQDYQGSVAVISPFRAQVAHIRQLVDRCIPVELRQRARLKIALADSVHGGMRDVVLFSPVAGPGFATDTTALADRRRFNAAISRARAVVHVFGNLPFARDSGLRHLRLLAEKAVGPGIQERQGLESLWQRRVDAALRARGLDPRPQYTIAGRKLDFAIFGAGEIRLGLEVDGRQWRRDPDQQRKVGDLWRDHKLKRQGWRVRRFWVHELERDMEGCLDRVERDLAG